MLNKTTKRIISLVLSMLLIMSCGIGAFAAVSETDELREGMGRFRTGNKGPETGTLAKYVTEYSYSSPLDRDHNSTKKYPVVFMIGKTRTVGNPGAELRETSFPLWATDSYQQRFYDAGGAFIVLTRPHPVETYFGGIENEAEVRNSLKAMINDFLSKNADHVDKSRVYLVAWDEGCKLAIKLAAESNTFAAMVLSSPTYLPSSDEFGKLAGIPIWLFACKKDEKAAFGEYGTKFWDGIKNTTAHSYVCRYTTFDSFNTTSVASYERHHETWEYAAYDCRYPGEQSGAKTIDGQERSYKFDKGSDGVIDWLSKIGSDYGSDCTCDCHHATGWARFLWNLKMLISMMFKLKWNRECACGAIHF